MANVSRTVVYCPDCAYSLTSSETVMILSRCSWDSRPLVVIKVFRSSSYGLFGVITYAVRYILDEGLEIILLLLFVK
jgi:hypothetical protein